MYRIVITSLLAVGTAVAAEAQTFLDRLQKPAKNQGSITVHQDAAIDALVNGPYTAPAAPAQKPRKAEEEKPATTTETPKSQTTKEQPKRETEKAETTTAAPAETPDTRKKVMRNSYKVTGFRVQVFAGGNSRRDRQKAEQIGENIKANIPGEPVYVHFYSPRWICRMGNYRTYEEAHQMLQAVRKLGYTQASIVKGKISVQY